jgi:S1-C subfamily serine protease
VGDVFNLGEASKSNGAIVTKIDMLDFTPTAQCPGLQYVEHVDSGGAADQAGLLPGDFIMEVSG